MTRGGARRPLHPRTGGRLINPRTPTLLRHAALTIVLGLFAQVSHAGGQQPVPPPTVSKPPAIQAASAILVDADTGQVLYEKNADAPRPPASTTKIMTATLLLENTQPTDVLVTSKRAAQTGGSSLNLKAGERITAHDMLYALMLRSANDGCVVVAERVAGTEAKFAEMMTEKAHEIGAVNTHFGNSNGLNENPNVTTARDLSIMARYAFRYPAFNEAIHTKLYKITRAKENKDTLLKNHAKFLWHFPGADGVKTGFTNPAGHCFVGAATWNGWRLVSVVLHSPDIVRETSALMKYGFQQFEPHEVVDPGQPFGEARVEGGAAPSVTVTAGSAIKIITRRGVNPSVELRPKLESIAAPVAAGTRVGTVEAWEDGRLVGAAPLVAGSAVGRAAATVGGAGSGGWYLFGALAGTVVIGYGRTVTKAARIRRYRLKALLRDADNGGPGLG